MWPIRYYVKRTATRLGPWSLAALALFVCGIGVPLCVFTSDTPALSYLDTTLPLLSNTLHPGDAVAAWTGRCNRFNHNIPYEYMRKIVALSDDARASVLSQGEGFAPPGCVRSWVTLVTLPPALAPGLYRIDGVNIVSGQWRSFAIDWTTEEFEVLPDDD